MAEPYIGQIIMFAGNFAIRSWAFCDGQLLPIAQNTALFSILGTTYGGDGRTTFGLPDLRGRVAIHEGRGPGLSNYQLGQKGGQERVTLQTTEIPAHNHTGTLRCVDDDGSLAGPKDNNLANASSGTPYSSGAADANMKTGSVTTDNTGGNQSHYNIQPFQVVNYEIALQGLFPPRN